MTFNIVALDIPSAELEEAPLGQPTAEPLEGEILVRKRVFFTDEEHGIISGTWESEPGVSRWEFLQRGEIIQVLSGRMTVHEDGGEPVELTPGMTAIFPLGWSGVWTVHERLRKMFVIFQRRG